MIRQKLIVSAPSDNADFFYFYQMDNPKFSYQNRLLENIKGEKWKNIPGLEGYFVISDHGRVKRMEYELPFADGRVYQMKSVDYEKPTLAKSLNRYKK